MELWQTVSKMLKILLTFWFGQSQNGEGKNYMNCSFCPVRLLCWLGTTWRMSNVCWWEWWNSRKYARAEEGQPACKYNELEWEVESLLLVCLCLPAACTFMSIKNWRRIYTDNQAQSSAFSGGGRGKIAWKAKGEPKTTGDNSLGFSPLAFFYSFYLCASAWEIAQLIKSLPSGWHFAFMHIKLAENLMLMLTSRWQLFFLLSSPLLSH